jgi:mannose-6-phosphate isomerase-like protein (cupin superfamily)
MTNSRLKRKIVGGLAWILFFVVAVLSQVHIDRAATAPHQTQAPTAGGRAPQPLSTELYDEWTLAQISTPGNLGNFGNHTASVQHREPGSAAEVHTGYSHVLIFTSGSGNFVIGGQIVDGPGGTKIIQGGESHKIVLGEVWHIPANIPHQVVADPGSPGVNYFHANINVPPASGAAGAP